MKFSWNSKYATIAAYALIVVFCVLLCGFLLVGDLPLGKILLAIIGVFQPILFGVLIAYLLNPVVRFFETKLFRLRKAKRSHRLLRLLSVFSTYIFVVLILALFVWQIAPKILRGYNDLQQMSGFYLEAVKEWLAGLSRGEGMFAGYIDQFFVYISDLLETLYTSIGAMIPEASSVAMSALSVLKSLFLGVVLSIYFLLAKERLVAQVKKTGHAILSHSHYASVAHLFNLGEKNFGGFLKGQLANALIMGVSCFVLSLIIGFPYYPLVSTIVGVAMLVPVFGLLIGMAAGSLIILLADPVSVLWFLLMMIVLGEIDRRLIRPHVIRVGADISSALMLAAIIVGTGLFGVWGLILGIPFAAVLYALIRTLIDKRLKKKGLATDRFAYLSTEAGRQLYLETEAHRTRRAGRSRARGGKGTDVFTEEVPCITDEQVEAYQEENAEKTETSEKSNTSAPASPEDSDG